jgi:hypothetical protein
VREEGCSEEGCSGWEGLSKYRRCTNRGYSRKVRELALGCTGEVARIEGPPDPLRFLCVATGLGVGAGAGAGGVCARSRMSSGAGRW